MREYRVVVAPSARKELKRLPKQIAERSLHAVNGLADNPRPHGSIKLQGGDNKYRLRVGDYRVVYSIFDDIAEIRVLRIRHRKDVYRFHDS